MYYSGATGVEGGNGFGASRHGVLRVDGSYRRQLRV